MIEEDAAGKCLELLYGAGTRELIQPSYLEILMKVNTVSGSIGLCDGKSHSSIDPMTVERRLLRERQLPEKCTFSMANDKLLRTDCVVTGLKAFQATCW